MTIEACIKCSDIKSSISFYSEILDFSVQVAPDPDINAFMSKYALLKRDGSFLHLSSHAGDGKLTEQTWGMKEFSVRDPDGNKITFGQEISNSSSN